MRQRAMWTWALVLALGVTLGAVGDDVEESMREIPVAYDVDVVVVGGSTGGVAAAVAAAEQGAGVFLAAQRPYLGEDMCSTYRLWLEPGETLDSPLAQALYAEPDPTVTIAPGVPFTYETDRPSADKHKDTSPPSMLCDGKWDDAIRYSVQYDGATAITLDLGKKQQLGRIHVMAFQRWIDIELDYIEAFVSDDKETWQAAGSAENPLLNQGDYIDEAMCITVPIKGEGRYVRLNCVPTERVTRFLLGEIIVETQETLKEVERLEVERRKGVRIPPMPMQVKRTLDNALLDAGVQFLFGSYVTDVLRDDDGHIAGVVIANRAGRQAVRARCVIDATPRATVARIAGAGFAPYPGGPQTFTRVVVGGEPHVLLSVGVREMPTPVQVQHGGRSSGAYLPAYEYTFSIPMRDGSWHAFAQAEQAARHQTWDIEQVMASERLFQVPPDPVKAEKPSTASWSGADALELGALRPAGQPGIYVLGGCADLPRESAAKLLRPVNYMAVGERVGRQAAADLGLEPKPCVVCFGDSITASGYPALLDGKLAEAKVVNAGVGGNTSAQGLERIQADVLDKSPAAVVVLFGANDSVLNEAEKYRVPLADYERNLAEIVAKCADAAAKVVLCTLPPIVDEPYFTRHPKEAYDAEGGLQSILAKYREAVKRVAEKNGVLVVDLESVFSGEPTLLAADGVHPTALGRERIAGAVAETVEPLLPAPRKRPETSVRVAGSEAKDVVAGDIGEILAGVRHLKQDLPTLPSGPRGVPVIARYDVVVVGGGTGGAPAGIGSARKGAKTLVIEYLHGLGGVGTLGLIGKYYYGYREGFTREIDLGIAAMGGEQGEPQPSWNVEWRMEWYRRELRKAGADIWFGSLACGAVVEDGRVKGVVVATPDGRGVILADAVIDATGNADVAAAAGAECMTVGGDNIAMQGTGMPPRKPGARYTNTDYTMSDDSDMVDQWRTFVAARDKYKNAYDLGQIIDSRERRRIVGDFIVSPLDIFNGRTYPDSICVSHSNFDTHGYTIHPLFALRAPDKKGVSGYLPIRALLPRKLERLFCIGLGLSAHRDAMPILRMQPDIQNHGYAAGYAAAMASADDLDLRDIDLKALQRHLVNIGCIPENTLTDTDSYPFSKEEIAEAVASIPKEWDGLGVVLAQFDDAKPLLQQAYKNAADDHARVTYAHLLGMMGDPTGADALAHDIAATKEWDPGWNFKGGGQFGTSLSPLDSKLVALARTGDSRAVELVAGKMELLHSGEEFSHHRAVALALETLRDPKGAKPLAELLSKPGMAGQQVLTIQDAANAARQSDPNIVRDHCLRELILARALFRCGDYNGLGEQILTAYTKDLRGHYARHAQSVLMEGK